jgi:hypothetical protein
MHTSGDSTRYKEETQPKNSAFADTPNTATHVNSTKKKRIAMLQYYAVARAKKPEQAFSYWCWSHWIRGHTKLITGVHIENFKGIR